MLGLEGDVEGVRDVVLGHCCYGDVFRVREGRFGGSVNIAQELSDFADAVGAVIEEEKGVIV